MHEICLIRIKEQVGEKWSTVCTHRNANCWKTRPRNKTNMLSIKKSSMLISVSERHSIQRNLPSHCTYVINYSYISILVVNIASIRLSLDVTYQSFTHSLTYPTFLLYQHDLVILVVNIASILLTWYYISIIHSLIDVHNIRTVPKWFSYRCNKYSIHHSLTHKLYLIFVVYIYGLLFPSFFL